MTLTVLFDLDDTLLHTHIHEFMLEYYDGLGKALADLAPADQILQHMKSGQRAMTSNQDPGLLLHQAFSAQFYPPLNTTESAQTQTLAEYYSQRHPQLENIIEKDGATKGLIDWCKVQGFTLAIATNPLFPEVATRQRIEWAGLNPDDFEFFSSFNTFHFTKPSLAYYAECLGRLGWPEGQIVMIGDSLKYDLLPMETMGFPTFWINTSDDEADRPHGPLSDVQAWLSGLAVREPAEISNSYEVNTAILLATPAVFDSWIRENSFPIFQAKPDPEEWNLIEVFWHLADMEKEINLPQWQQLLDNPQSLLTVPDTSRWAIERGYYKRSISDAWKQFVTARKQSLTCIEEIKTKGLMDATVQHTVFSQVTVSELISFAAKHDRIHLRQCKALLDFYKIY